MNTLVRVLLGLALGGFAAVSFAESRGGGATPAAEIPQNPAGFQIRRGVNLSHWLSQRIPWANPDTFITERDLEYIRSIGYDHVRIPIDEIELWNDKGEPVEAEFRHLTDALGWARKHGLRAIVDLHTVRTHHFNASNEGGHNTLFSDPAAQTRFLELWREISGRLKGFGNDWVAYEIMNEPVADDPEDWNKLIAKSFTFLRQLEPNRVIVIGANRWQTAASFPFLKVPAGDRNIILSVHSYEPMLLTHHTAEWTPIRDYRGPVTYPGVVVTKADVEAHVPATNTKLREAMNEAGEVWDRARIQKTLQPAFDKARELGLQLYCGEFGCLPTVPREARLAYYGDIISVLQENGAAWANWEYKADFGIVPFRSEAESRDAKPDPELINALLGGK